MKISQGTIYDFLNTIATKPCTPAGGSTAALCAAAAAAFIEMVARHTINKEDGPECGVQGMEKIAEIASAYRHEFLDYMDKDAEAYQNLIRAQQNKEESMDKYYKDSVKIPLAMANKLLSMIDMIEDVFKDGSKTLLTDSAAALLTAKSTFISLIYHIKFNLIYIKDKDFIDQVQEEIGLLEEQLEWLIKT